MTRTTIFAIAVGVIVLPLFAAQPLLASIGPSFGITSDNIGIVAMMPMLGYATGLFFLVPLTDLVEVRRLVLVTLGVGAAALIAVAASPSALSFLLAAFIVGVTTTANQMLIPLAASLATEAVRGSAIGRLMSGLMIGVLRSRPVASRAANAFGWRGASCRRRRPGNRTPGTLSVSAVENRIHSFDLRQPPALALDVAIGGTGTSSARRSLTGLSNSSLVPNFLATVVELRPEQSGVLLLTTGALPMVVLVPLSIYLLGHFDSRAVVMLGFSAFAVANLLGTQLTHDWAREDFIGIVLLQSFGQVFTLLAILIMALSNLDPTRATAFAAYIQIMRLGGAEIGVAVMGTLLRVREQVHSYYLGVHIDSGSANVTQLVRELTNYFSGDGEGSAAARATSFLAKKVEREANVLAYIDGFWLCFWFAVAGLVVTACITRAPPGPFTPEPFKSAKIVT